MVRPTGSMSMAAAVRGARGTRAVRPPVRVMARTRCLRSVDSSSAVAVHTSKTRSPLRPRRTATSERGPSASAEAIRAMSSSRASPVLAAYSRARGRQTWAGEREQPLVYGVGVKTREGSRAPDDGHRGRTGLAQGIYVGIDVPLGGLQRVEAASGAPKRVVAQGCGVGLS